MLTVCGLAAVFLLSPNIGFEKTYAKKKGAKPLLEAVNFLSTGPLLI
jgi:hypothetical protein